MQQQVHPGPTAHGYQVQRIHAGRHAGQPSDSSPEHAGHLTRHQLKSERLLPCQHKRMPHGSRKDTMMTLQTLLTRILYLEAGLASPGSHRSLCAHLILQTLCQFPGAPGQCCACSASEREVTQFLLSVGMQTCPSAAETSGLQTDRSRCCRIVRLVQPKSLRTASGVRCRPKCRGSVT